MEKRGAEAILTALSMKANFLNGAYIAISVGEEQASGTILITIAHV